MRTFGQLGKVATFNVVVSLQENLSKPGRSRRVVLVEIREVRRGRLSMRALHLLS